MSRIPVAILALLINTVIGEPSLKPCGLPSHTCFLDRCLLASCPKYPQARCRDYKCGDTCEAEFWYNGQEVTSMCGNDPIGSIFGSGKPTDGTSSNTVNGGSTGIQTTGCPNGEAMVNCFRQPCSVSACPGVPTATCKDNYCGGCRAQYFLGQEEVTSQCPNTQPTGVGIPQVNNNLCPNGQQPVNCAARPCAINSCPRYPTASCRDNYCGGCSAQFFVGQEEVTSNCARQIQTAVAGPQMNYVTPNVNIGGCPQNQIVQCDYSPCRISSCANYPNAACRDVNCGGCYAKFFYNGQEVTSLCRQQQTRPQSWFPPWYWLFRDALF